MARKTRVRQETSIVNGDLYFEDCKQCSIDDPVCAEIVGDGYTKSIRVVSLASGYVQRVYIDWNVTQKEELSVEMTLRREIRSNRGHWYAYRRVLGTLHKRYVGTDDEINTARILEIAEKMPAIVRRVY